MHFNVGGTIGISQFAHPAKILPPFEFSFSDPEQISILNQYDDI